MDTIYTNGEYLESNQSWHVEDSPWKAGQIGKIIGANQLRPQTIAEIGCGAGAILSELSRQAAFAGVTFSGYDISSQAMQLAKARETAKVQFFQKDLLAASAAEHFDVLLVIDVFEHVPDYMGFLEKCRGLADYKLFHIPLEIHVLSVLRNVYMNGRYKVGHLHYFTADSALATLRDTGYEVVDYFYTNAAFDLFRQHPSFRKLVANVPRWFFSKLSVPFTARVFGGYSLLVLAK